MALWISEEFVNLDKGYRFGSEPMHETMYTERGALFRALQREYGRCVSTMYREPDGRSVGWVFQRREEYADNRGNRRDTYMREVWVSVEDRNEEEV